MKKSKIVIVLTISLVFCVVLLNVLTNYENIIIPQEEELTDLPKLPEVNDTIKYYNYEDLGIVSAKKPFNTHLWWVISDTLWLMVDSTNQLVLLKSVDKGANWTTVTTRDHKIQSGWNDGTYIWLVDCDNDATADDFDVWKITIDGNETITPIGTSTGADADTVYAGDIFIITGDVFVVNFEKRSTLEKVVVWEVASAPFTEKNVFNCDPFEFEKWYKGIVFGDKYYNVMEDLYSTNEDLVIMNYDKSDIDIDFTERLYDYIRPINLSSAGMAYDNDNLIYFIEKKVSDSKNYLVAYSISDDSFTIGGEYNVAIMLDRNTALGVMEKAFHLTEYKVYQLHPNASYQLYFISNVPSDAVLIGITDNFLMNDDGDIFEYVDVSSYMTRIEFAHEIMNYSEGTLGVRRDRITIEKGMFMQILGNYTSNEVPKIFKGTYNFSDYADGTSGTDIDWVTSGADADHCVIEASYLTHKKVMSFFDDDGFSIAYRSITQATAGTREWWIAVPDNTLHTRIYFQEGTGDGNLCFHLRFTGGQIQNWNGVNLIALSNATYFHLKVIWFADNTASVYINGNIVVTTLAMANNQVSGIDTISLRGYSNDANKKLYIDAWGDPDNDANYNIGDNLVVEGGETDQVIFEGIVVDFDGELLTKVWLESPAKKELKEKKPRGDFSGRSDEIMVSLVSTYCKYITIGTLSTGTAMGTITYAGDKSLMTILTELALFENWVWSLTPQGKLNFNDGTIDSLVDLSKTDKIWNVKSGEIRAPYNYFYVKGAIVNGVQLEKEIEDADDLVSQQLHGYNPYEKTFASFNSQSVLNQLTTNIKAKLKEIPLVVEHWHYDASLGMIAICETVTFVYDTTNVNITSDQFLYNRVLFKAQQNAGGYTIATKLV